MAHDFYKSPEGLAEYKKAGLSYDDEMWDKSWEDFEHLCRKTSAKDAKVEIQSMVRLVLPTGEEYIVHDRSDIRKDPLGNVKRHYRSGFGTYPIPQPHYEIKVNVETGETEKYTSGLDGITTGYSIPFSKAKADELYKWCTDSTGFIVQKGYKGMGFRIKVDSFEDWRDVEKPEFLIRFGHAPSKYELQVYEDELSGKIQQQTPNAVVNRQYG